MHVAEYVSELFNFGDVQFFLNLDTTNLIAAELHLGQALPLLRRVVDIGFTQVISSAT